MSRKNLGIVRDIQGNVESFTRLHRFAFLPSLERSSKSVLKPRPPRAVFRICILSTSIWCYHDNQRSSLRPGDASNNFNRLTISFLSVLETMLKAQSFSHRYEPP